MGIAFSLHLSRILLENKLIMTEREHAARWIKHFRHTLNQTEPDDSPDLASSPEQLDIDTDLPTEDGVMKAVLAMISGKAPGADMIHAYALNADSTTAVRALFDTSGSMTLFRYRLEQRTHSEDTRVKRLEELRQLAMCYPPVYTKQDLLLDRDKNRQGLVVVRGVLTKYLPFSTSSGNVWSEMPHCTSTSSTAERRLTVCGIYSFRMVC